LWPPDTVLGFSLFLSRGVELIKTGSAGYANITRSVGYSKLPTTEWHPLELLALREKIIEMKLDVTDYIGNSGEYYYKKTKCNVDLFRLVKTKASKPLYRIFRGKIPY